MPAEPDHDLLTMQGLTDAEAAARLAQVGPNVLQQASARSFAWLTP